MENLTYTRIKSRSQYNTYCDKLESILQKDSISQEEVDHIELLTLLIEDWDEENGIRTIVDPIQLLSSLKKEHGLSNDKLARIGGVRPEDMNAIFDGEKQIPSYAGQRFADYFKIRPKVFEHNE